ncbi:MAG: stage V sporulation protein G [Lysobacterales bacterium]|jgi:stage V sporulation protein G
MKADSLSIKVSRLYPLKTDGPLKAFCDIEINNALLIKGVKVVHGRTGTFVAMPQEQAKDNKWYDSVRCLNGEVRQQISEEVLSVYEQQTLVTE